MDDLPSPPTTQSFIGITVAIAGNVLISLALNCQKLAHMRLEQQQNDDDDFCAPERPEDATLNYETDDHNDDTDETPRATNINDRARAGRKYPYINPSGFRSQRNSLALDLESGSSPPPERAAIRPGHLQVASPRMTSPARSNRVNLPPISSRTIPEDRLPSNNTTPEDSMILKRQDSTHSRRTNETAYLKSKLWWTGFLLLNVGELGNFISYAFAPASVVAPLGAFALIANCFFAPLILKERFRRSDIAGVALSICGAVTVVYASKSSNPTLDPDALLRAIGQRAFIIYASISAVGALVLSSLSDRRAGQEHIFVDVGLCAIFGGFTVLSTKAVSTLISLKSIEVFQEWITYPLLIVLIGTGVGQIRYLNRALMKFDGKTVIPTQFVLFNLSAIIGSAMLYRDFDNISVHRFVVFLYGCAATFLGVLLLTRPAIPSIFKSLPSSPSAPSTPSSTHPSLSYQNAPTDVTPLLARVQPPSSPIQLRNRNSTASLGLSPAQYLLLVTGSPRESTAMPRTRAGSINGDWEPGSASRTTGSIGRRFGVIPIQLPQPQPRADGDS